MHADQRQLFHTHLPYSHLPSSIKSHARNCKLIYIARDPKDTLISQWHFFNKILTKESDPPFPLDRAVESFCTGAIPFGPYWDHVLEYWEASQRSPEKVMFIKYEDLRRDPKPHVRKLASFLDDDDVEVEKVIWRSSFDRLKGLDANKTGMIYPVLSPLLTSDPLQKKLNSATFFLTTNLKSLQNVTHSATFFKFSLQMV
ncbi:Cytosolic sulfotransferase 17 [Linum perenne]